MPTPVPLSILSRRDQRIRLIIVLLLALGMGIAARAIRPHLSGPVHYEALVSLVVLSAACLVLLLGLRRISYWRAALVFIIEMTALWACFVIGWIIIERQLVEDLFAVIGLFWASTVAPGLLVLWLIQQRWPPRRSMTCPVCEYDLRGLTSSVCPECGCLFKKTCAGCGCVLTELARGECPDCRSDLTADAVLVVTRT